jgi:hypothetical protein
MDEIDAVLTIFLSGAAAGLTATAEQSVKDAYATLKSRLRSALTRRGADPGLVDAVEEGDEKAESELRTELRSGDLQPDLVAAAEKLDVELRRHEVPAVGPVIVGDITKNQGVVIGNHAAVTMRFGDPPRPQ